MTGTFVAAPDFVAAPGPVAEPASASASASSASASATPASPASPAFTEETKEAWIDLLTLFCDAEILIDAEDADAPDNTALVAIFSQQTAYNVRVALRAVGAKIIKFHVHTDEDTEEDDADVFCYNTNITLEVWAKASHAYDDWIDETYDEEASCCGSDDGSGEDADAVSEVGDPPVGDDPLVGDDPPVEIVEEPSEEEPSEDGPSEESEAST